MTETRQQSEKKWVVWVARWLSVIFPLSMGILPCIAQNTAADRDYGRVTKKALSSFAVKLKNSDPKVAARYKGKSRFHAKGERIKYGRRHTGRKKQGRVYNVSFSNKAKLNPMRVADYKYAPTATLPRALAAVPPAYGTQKAGANVNSPKNQESFSPNASQTDTVPDVNIANGAITGAVIQGDAVAVRDIAGLATQGQLTADRQTVEFCQNIAQDVRGVVGDEQGSSLTIRSADDDFEVTVDDESTYPAPSTIFTKPGFHKLSFTRDDGVTVETPINLAAASQTIVDISTINGNIIIDCVIPAKNCVCPKETVPLFAPQKYNGSWVIADAFLDRMVDFRTTKMRPLIEVAEGRMAVSRSESLFLTGGRAVDCSGNIYVNTGVVENASGPVFMYGGTALNCTGPVFLLGDSATVIQCSGPIIAIQFE